MNERPLFLILFLAISHFALSQNRILLDTIKASNNKVDIRVGTDYFAKGGWHLEPFKDPDIFKIGSKWDYDELIVSFITDIDSISMSTQPGGTYDFGVMLHGELCHIQVITAPNPIFFNRTIIIGLLLLFVVCIWFFFRLHHLSSIRILLLFGVVSPILFWIFTWIGGYIQEDYHHIKSVISQLGTIGSRGELFASCALVIIAFSTVAFSIGFIKASRQLDLSRLPSYSTIALAISFLWAAIFPLGNEFHSLLGGIPLILMIGTLLSIVLWRKGSDLKTVHRYAAIALIFMLLLLLRFIPSIGHEYEGGIQRLFYLGWSIWFCAISINFRKKLIHLDKT